MRAARVLPFRWAGLLAAALAALPSRPDTAHGIPYFARKYNVACSQCHVTPPKLNAFGERFRERGYRAPTGFVTRHTLPLAVWLSGRSDALHDEERVRDEVRAYINKLELISGGQVVAPWLAYFVEWRPVSLETRKRSGIVELRDRAGRFEDLFLTATTGRADLTVGQFRQLNQVDVSLRLGLSEPLVLSASLPGSDEGLPRDPGGALSPAGSRQLSLRGFSPAGRSPAVRLGWTQPLRGGWSWKSAAALPVPGEFSIPLTDEARVEASNEFEAEPKGIFIESFLRRGLTSIGAHVFYNHSERFLAQAMSAGNRGPFHWTAIGGVARAGDALRGRWSLEAEYLPHYFFGLGGRVEDRAADRASLAFLPYLNAHFPGSSYTLRLTIEQRVQRQNHATLIELGTVF